MTRRSAVLASLACAVMLNFSFADATWGDLSGQFIYGGPAPAPAAFAPAAAVCVAAAPVDESLLVDAKTNGLANVVVYMYLKKNDQRPEIHADYAKTEKDKITVDNQACRFAPHVLAMRTTQTLVLGNKDATGHNVKADFLANPAFNLLVPANGTQDVDLPMAERLPVPMSCNIHPFMKGYVLVNDNPYFAVTDKDGKFKIKNVPSGEWVFQFWHEKLGYVKEVEIGGAKAAWKKGRLPIQIAAKGTNLGVVTVPPLKK